MAKDTLDMFIKDVEYAANYDYKKEIGEIFAQILRVMAVRTITDTNQAKSILADIAMEKLNINIYDVLDETYDGWKNWDRYEGNGKYSAELISSSEGYALNFTAEDWGLANQEFNDVSGKDYPTKNENYYSRTGRPKAYQPHHITRTCDDVEDGKLTLVEAKINGLLDKLVSILEGR